MKSNNVCSKCGKPSSREDICGVCYAREEVEVQCPDCKETRTIQRGYMVKLTAYRCHLCTVKKNARKPVIKMVTLTCTVKGCTNVFETRLSSSRDSRFTGRCPSCRKVNKNAKKKENYHSKRFVGDEIEMHGCTLVPRESRPADDEGMGRGRCSRYLICPFGHYSDVLGIPDSEQCLNAVSKLSWPGWGIKNRMKEYTIPPDVMHRYHYDKLGETNYLCSTYSPPTYVSKWE